jgi:hypothetical protein
MEHWVHGGALDALGSVSLLAFGVVSAAGFAMGLAPSSYALGASAGWFARLRAATAWVPRLQIAAGWLLLLGGAVFLAEAVRAAWTLYA